VVGLRFERHKVTKVLGSSPWVTETKEDKKDWKRPHEKNKRPISCSGKRSKASSRVVTKKKNAGLRRKKRDAHVIFGIHDPLQPVL